jgi:hypothetical protein
MPDKSKLTNVIAQCHNVLNEIFLLHQEAVVLGKFSEAMQLLNYYRELHDLHKTFEDEKLLPKFDELGNRGRWPASLYALEHSKIQDLMEKTENNLVQLGQSQLDGKNLRRNIIAFIDREKTFKGYCEHHQEREEEGLLPELDRQTDSAWRVAVIGTFIKDWDCCMKRNMKSINNIDFIRESNNQDS